MNNNSIRQQRIDEECLGIGFNELKLCTAKISADLQFFEQTEPELGKWLNCHHLDIHIAELSNPINSSKLHKL